MCQENVYQNIRLYLKQETVELMQTFKTSESIINARDNTFRHTTVKIEKQRILYIKMRVHQIT
jgi:hypothetical protein